MKIYELEIRIKDRFTAKNKKEAKKEMTERLRGTLADSDGKIQNDKILWRLSCKLYGEYPCST